jgi:hypothetical protein
MPVKKKNPELPKPRKKRKVEKKVRYYHKYAKMAYELSILGATHEKIREILEIPKDIFYRFRKEYPEFKAALEAGKASKNDQVVMSLFKRAIGYEYVETTEEPFANVAKIIKELSVLSEVTEDDLAKIFMESMIPTKRVTKQMAGDVKAQLAWLYNKMSEDWKYRQEVDMIVTDKTKAVMEAVVEAHTKMLEKGELPPDDNALGG